MTRAYTSEFSTQDDVTYCWERCGVPPGLHLCPTTEAKTRYRTGKFSLWVVWGGGIFFFAAGKRECRRTHGQTEVVCQLLSV